MPRKKGSEGKSAHWGGEKSPERRGRADESVKLSDTLCENKHRGMP